ncbi:MAG: DUF523 domain-containing protein [Bradymonadaceae bacterium]
MERTFSRPRIVLSQCLELAAVRYNGERIEDAFIRDLLPHVDVIPVCPEVGIGLGVPRDPIRLVAEHDGTHLIQPSTGRDLTPEMEGFARDFLTKLGPIDGFILKSSSPSCGIEDVKVRGGLEESSVIRREAGLFAREVLERFDDLVVESESRLKDPEIRRHFLTRLFGLADLRVLGKDVSPERLSPYPSELM